MRRNMYHFKLLSAGLAVLFQQSICELRCSALSGSLTAYGLVRLEKGQATIGLPLKQSGASCPHAFVCEESP